MKTETFYIIEWNDMYYYGTIEDNNFYHQGGNSYMHVSTEYKLLKQFEVKRDNTTVETGLDIEVEYWKAQPRPEPVTEVPKNGWKLPDGRMYSCSYGRHERLLAQLISLELEEYPDYIQQAKAAKKGWRSIRDGEYNE